jgi:hypothetical protein
MVFGKARSTGKTPVKDFIIKTRDTVVEFHLLIGAERNRVGATVSLPHRRQYTRSTARRTNESGQPRENSENPKAGIVKTTWRQARNVVLRVSVQKRQANTL